MRIFALGAFAALALFLYSCKSEKSSEESTEGPAQESAAEELPSVVLEIDQLEGTPEFPDSVIVNGSEIKLTSIYSEAGINLIVKKDQLHLPSSSPLTERDLLGYMNKYRNVDAGENSSVYCLIAHGADDEYLHGIMFTPDTRQGVAVFTEDLSGLDTAQKNAELLRRAAHEIAHAFNIHHADYDGTFSDGGTLEGYSPVEELQWHLSAKSRGHFAHHPGREFMPESGFPFRFVSRDHVVPHEPTDESYILVDDFGSGQSEDNFTPLTDEEGQRLKEPPLSRLELELIAPKSTFSLAEPVMLTATLRNIGTQPIKVSPALLPEYGFLDLAIQHPGSSRFRPFVPSSARDPISIAEIPLPPGETLSQEVKLVVGADKWIFDTPGHYKIRAVYHDPVHSKTSLAQTTIALDVSGLNDQAANDARALINDKSVGLFMQFGGVDHLARAREKLNAFIENHHGSQQALTMRMLLALDAILPQINPANGQRPPARLTEAYQLSDGLTELGAAQGLPASGLLRLHALMSQAFQQRGMATEARRILLKAIINIKLSHPRIKPSVIFKDKITQRELSRALGGLRLTADDLKKLERVSLSLESLRKNDR